jgi:hypothetical protein
VPFPANDTLFVNRDVYTHLIDIELMVMAHRVDRAADMRATLRHLLGWPPVDLDAVLRSFRGYARPLAALPGTRTVAMVDAGLVNRTVPVAGPAGSVANASTPSLVALPDGTYVVNVAYVDFRADAASGKRTVTAAPRSRLYTGAAPVRVACNARVRLTADLARVDGPAGRVQVFGPSATTSLEGLRLSRSADGTVGFLATSAGEGDSVAVHTGTYPLVASAEDTLASSAVLSPTRRLQEGNWAAIAGGAPVVYEW